MKFVRFVPQFRKQNNLMQYLRFLRAVMMVISAWVIVSCAETPVEYQLILSENGAAFAAEGGEREISVLPYTPPYTIYIFCTTEPNKIPITVLNRTQRHNITKIPASEINARLITICQAEGFTNYEATCDLISKTSHGCMRDAIMKLDQCSNFNTDLSLANVEQILNTSYYNAMCYLTQALLQKADPEILYAMDKLYNSGVDLKGFIEVYIEFILDLAKYAIFQDLSITNIPEYLVPVVNGIISAVPERLWYTRLVDTLLQIKLETRYDSFYKSTIEAFLLRFCNS